MYQQNYIYNYKIPFAVKIKYYDFILKNKGDTPLSAWKE